MLSSASFSLSTSAFSVVNALVADQYVNTNHYLRAIIATCEETTNKKGEKSENIIIFATFQPQRSETDILMKVFSHYPFKKMW